MELWASHSCCWLTENKGGKVPETLTVNWQRTKVVSANRCAVARVSPVSHPSWHHDDIVVNETETREEVGSAPTCGAVALSGLHLTCNHMAVIPQYLPSLSAGLSGQSTHMDRLPLCTQQCTSGSFSSHSFLPKLPVNSETVTQGIPIP